MGNRYFSANYAEARDRFRDAAKSVGGNIQSYEFCAETQNHLAMDVAIVGPAGAPTVVVSSGIHGVEGFFGSAIQLAFLQRHRRSPRVSNVQYVLIHSLNPFGFSNLRRVNEENVDLNRNFLDDPAKYAGSPDGYIRLNGFLNPESPPSRFEPFRLKAMWKTFRQGRKSLKESIAAGQYTFPRGLFFGGHGPSKSTRIVQENCDSWIGTAMQVVHLDFHSGLGHFGNYKLLINDDTNSTNFDWYASTFGADRVEPQADANGTAYRISGQFGGWMQQHFDRLDYRFAGVEFGTYDVARVLAALRAENRAHHFCPRNSKIYQSAKEELLECFCPANPAWRDHVVDAGMDIIDQAEKTLK